MSKHIYIVKSFSHQYDETFEACLLAFRSKSNAEDHVACCEKLDKQYKERLQAIIDKREQEAEDTIDFEMEMDAIPFMYRVDCIRLEE